MHLASFCSSWASSPSFLLFVPAWVSHAVCSRILDRHHNQRASPFMIIIGIVMCLFCEQSQLSSKIVSATLSAMWLQTLQPLPENCCCEWCVSQNIVGGDEDGNTEQRAGLSEERTWMRFSRVCVCCSYFDTRLVNCGPWYFLYSSSSSTDPFRISYISSRLSAKSH